MRNIPNILSFLRIVMVGVFIYLFVKAEYLGCLVIYIVAFLTDVLDGFLARRFNWITNLGKLIDPFADKLMLLSVVVCLFAIGKLPWYVLAVIVLKELLLIIGGYVILKKRKVAVYADWWGKVATGLFFAAITLTLAKLALPDFLGFIPDIALEIGFLTALAISVFSLFHYAYKGGFIGSKYREHTAYDDDTQER